MFFLHDIGVAKLGQADVLSFVCRLLVNFYVNFGGGTGRMAHQVDVGVFEARCHKW